MTERVANSDARRYVQNLKEFKGSNTYSMWVHDRYGGSRYLVYSYGEHWPLFIYEDGKWYENADKYSRTTSKHHGQLHPLYATEEHSADDMVMIADLGVARWMRRKLTSMPAAV